MRAALTKEPIAVAGNLGDPDRLLGANRQRRVGSVRLGLLERRFLGPARLCCLFPPRARRVLVLVALYFIVVVRRIGV
jgi:hypothetical protein